MDTLERAERGDWDNARLAQSLEVSEDRVEFWRESYRRAKSIIDAPTPAESFRRGVRYSIQSAIEEGLTDEEKIENLVTQICYRAADMAYLLDLEEGTLSDYSRELRKESALDLGPLLSPWPPLLSQTQERREGRSQSHEAPEETYPYPSPDPAACPRTPPRDDPG